RRLKHVVNGAQADGYAQQVTQELDDAAIRAAAHQRQRDDHLAQPCFGDCELEKHAIFRRLGREGVIQRDTSLVRLLVDKLAAYLVPASQLTDGLRPGQRENGQILALTLRQLRRRATALIHVHTTNEKSGCRHPPWGRQPGLACNPRLNHASDLGRFLMRRGLSRRTANPLRAHIARRNVGIYAWPCRGEPSRDRFRAFRIVTAMRCLVAAAAARPAGWRWPRVTRSACSIVCMTPARRAGRRYRATTARSSRSVRSTIRACGRVMPTTKASSSAPGASAGAYRRRRGCSAATPRWSTIRRMSPPTEHPPAGIRIARSSNRPDLAQKAGTATQKIKVLTEKMAMQHDGPSSKYTASRHTNLPLFATRERTSTSVAARPGRTNLR